jgi:hypothetical protein
MYGVLEKRMARVIDYERLIAGYWDRLATILREFRPADECEFLDAWVPDDDDHRSIVSIVEAAKTAGLPCITLCLGAQTVQKLNLDRLKTTLAWYGKLELWSFDSSGTSISVEVSF